MDTPAHIDISGTSFEVAKWVWQNLVPKSGAATSVQGELLRSIERLRWEAQQNGNINWDEGFRLFIAFLRTTFLSQTYLSDEDRVSVAADLDRLMAFVPPD